MSFRKSYGPYVNYTLGVLATVLLAAGASMAGEPERAVFVLTSTNDPSANQVVVFRLEPTANPSLGLVDMLPTQGIGGAANNAGILQFNGDLGAVGNYGSNTVSQIVRRHNFIGIEGTIELSPNCKKPELI